MSHPTARALNDQLSPPQTPQSQPAGLDRSPGTPSSGQRLPYRFQSSSPYQPSEDYEAAPDAHAVTAYDPRQQAFAAEQEEEARARRDAHTTDLYPQPVGPPSQPHGFHAYPPVQAPHRPTSALQKPTMTNEQLEMLLVAAQKRKGHQFGAINLGGNGSVLAGNTFNDERYVPLLPDHRYHSITARDGWTGALLTGEQHVDIARDFLASPGKYAPPTSRSAPPVQAQQLQYYANGEPDFS